MATFDVIQIIEGSPEDVWNRCGQDSSSTKDSLMNYFEGKNLVYALKVGNFKWLEKPIDPREYIDKFYPPQFFQYVNGEKIFKLED
ncbi:hypothetical protein P6O24_08330 [Clostridium perfringens]|uniref:hypothetical protein n=1 Tax=Clostridium perfringens TaxID=1502 RepID=UPI001CAAF45C|nr:hypothetical protein [Clostridium perfringens]MDK0559081.1 hypothetical protein [Clostridium perfringens]MDK0563272.1 hypothetical protein [Clostridium perfringens]MDK0904144.1 hypothetical protein [Clostridium perfringens]MDM0937050.1 hypothetical protein [Clostridium perfringens]MDM0963061.1 hypothetical protein [Clostridium perfringens]